MASSSSSSLNSTAQFSLRVWERCRGGCRIVWRRKGPSGGGATASLNCLGSAVCEEVQKSICGARWCSVLRGRLFWAERKTSTVRKPRLHPSSSCFYNRFLLKASHGRLHRGQQGLNCEFPSLPKQDAFDKHVFQNNETVFSFSLNHHQTSADHHLHFHIYKTTVQLTPRT